MQLYCDMDGVLADFDTHYKNTFGVPCDKLLDNVDWKAVRGVPGFYANIPPMPDMLQLWAFISPYKPIILTGVPSSVDEAPANKRAWVDKNIGYGVEVITCKSRNKSHYCKPGDVLIDDWNKYRHLWIAKGGLWITHTTANETIKQLENLAWFGALT